MTPIFAFLIFAVLFVLELVYFEIADHFNIIDKPNIRSSHQIVTIRGGGIIFGIASIIFYLMFGFQYLYFILGLLAIAAISFIDDVLTLNNKLRLGFHLLAVLLLFYQWGLFDLTWYWIPLSLVFVIGTINAYNFMDGINGITGSYSLLCICTLYYINEKIISFTSSDFLIVVGLSLLVFNYFNFRKKAKCFAGDVGSVGIAFILVFLIGQLIIKAENFSYILLLLIYGLDAVSTIVFRIIRKENIFEAHRSHFYQYLANEKKWSHLMVSGLYFLTQLFINALVLFFVKDSYILTAVLVSSAGIIFLAVRFAVEGRKRLVGP